MDINLGFYCLIVMTVFVSQTKIVFFIVLISLFSLKSLANNNTPIHNGLAIGVIDKVDRSIIFLNHKLSLNLSATPFENKVYPAIPFSLLIDNDNLLHKVLSVEQTHSPKHVIVKYQIMPPMMKFRSLGFKHQVQLIDIHKAESTKQLNDWQDNTFKKPENTMKASGYLLRWYQQGSFDNLCSVSIHLGGEITSTKAFHSGTLIGFNKKGKAEEDIGAMIINEANENIAHFNITSKNGCLAAKQYLKAGKMVEIGFAKHYFHLFDIFKHTVHSLRVQKPKNSEIAER